MADGDLALGRVRNDAVWGHIGRLFLAALGLFLVNVALGFANVLTPGALPRWQFLTHLHAGTIGWITFSLIGIAVWVFTGRREVSATYVRRVGWLVGLGVAVFAGYIVSFGLAFSRGGPAFGLLPVVGGAAMLLIWGAALFVVTQLPRQPVVTTVHVLVAGGLLVAAVGATMGVLLGLERVIGLFLPIENPDRVGVHAGMMDAYIFIVASAIVEWFVWGEDAGRWTWPGMAQAVAGSLAAVLVPVAFLLNIVDLVLPVFGLLLLVFLALFLARVGHRGLRGSPLATGVEAWGVFGTAWLVVFVGLFLWLVLGLQGDFGAAPHWFEVTFTHAAYVGMMTNLLLGVVSARTEGLGGRLPRAEPTARWLLNLGLVLFIGLEIAAGTRHGAIVMGIGVLLAVGTMMRRLAGADDARAPAS